MNTQGPPDGNDDDDVDLDVDVDEEEFVEHEPVEDTATVMFNHRLLAMHQDRSWHDCSAKGEAYGLMSEAHT